MDTVHTNINQLEDNSLKAQRRRAAKPLLWVSIASMAMMFAGFTSGYVVSRTALVEEGRWMEFELPSIFWLSTVVVLAISVVLHLAMRKIKADDRHYQKRQNDR